ncbi:MAG: helix-turn-helix domain-containing protein [Pseudomonadota bacterium]
MSALAKEIGMDQVMRELRMLSNKVDRLAANKQPEFLTLGQVADMRGVCLRTVQRQVEKGEIETCRRYGQRVVRRDDV